MNVSVFSLVQGVPWPCLLDVMEDDLSVARGALLSGCAPLLAFTTRSHGMWTERQAKTLEKA